MSWCVYVEGGELGISSCWKGEDIDISFLGSLQFVETSVVSIIEGTLGKLWKGVLKLPHVITDSDNGEYIFGLLYQPWEDKRCYILMGNWIEFNKGTIHKMWKTNSHCELLIVSKSRKWLILQRWGEEEERRFIGIQRELELKMYRKILREETWPLVQKSSHCQPVASRERTDVLLLLSPADPLTSSHHLSLDRLVWRRPGSQKAREPP